MANSSESGHWYDKDGKPAYTYIATSGKYKGQERPTTLTQARKLNLVPSVTGILNVASNDGLSEWKQKQILLAAIARPRNKFEDVASFIDRIKEQAAAKGKEAARVGTLIHADIERGFNKEAMQEYEAAYHAVIEILTLLFPNEKWVSEDTFCSPSGYGGAIDLRNKKGSIFVDFKTKDDIGKKKGYQLIYENYGLQLSAYAHGKHCSDPLRVSIFIDRQKPEKAVFHIWDNVSHRKHLSMFFSLLSYWQENRNYKPVIEVN